MTVERVKASYHHGDLRAALLSAAAAMLAEAGIEGFSLRQVAKRVGVSHSAPAHHFGDTQGLIVALAAEGFRRFTTAMRARQAVEPPDPRSQLIGSGLGYVEFAAAEPALFQLMFGSCWSREPTSELAEASEAAFHVLTDGVASLRGVSPFEDPDAMAQVVGCWSIVHGYAKLMLAGQLDPMHGMPGLDREAMLRRIIERALG